VPPANCLEPSSVAPTKLCEQRKPDVKVLKSHKPSTTRKESAGYRNGLRDLGWRTAACNGLQMPGLTCCGEATERMRNLQQERPAGPFWAIKLPISGSCANWREEASLRWSSALAVSSLTFSCYRRLLRWSETSQHQTSQAYWVGTATLTTTPATQNPLRWAVSVLGLCDKDSPEGPILRCTSTTSGNFLRCSSSSESPPPWLSPPSQSSIQARHVNATHG
jgi:hypothetical protein